MAVNYIESATQTEPAPINAFNKSSGSVIGNGDTVVLPDAPATVFEHEAELGIVIGRRASAIKAEHAYDHIFAYVNFIDVSCRGAGPQGRDSFFIGKSWDTFGPMGPALVTADEVSNPHDLPIRLSVQGELRQDYSTSDMAHKIPEMLEWITWVTTLEPGDVVASGTNHRGLGPIQDGDTVEMEIGTFGKLTVHVTDAKKRSWPRETHAQREAREAAARVR
jgi:2-keto-4-pentenoate hydratase/2-oxohepta-3-ene-1,7-dioic acid hydratase in catechol pathway